jgi:hypothetical protein
MKWRKLTEVPQGEGEYIVYRNGEVEVEEVLCNSMGRPVYFWYNPQGITHWMPLPSPPTESETP